MDSSKIQLSSFEMDLVNNANWILTKNAIIEKAKALLSALQDAQLNQLQSLKNVLPPEVIAIPPKISRGENYKGLPWLMLDHPRYFDRENVFAIRTMFWWAHHFSLTLHLSGSYKEAYQEQICGSYEFLRTSNCFVSIHESEWEHHFESDNYMPVQHLTAEAFMEIVHTRPFLKLAQRLPLEKWNDAPAELAGWFNHYLALLADQLPRR